LHGTRFGSSYILNGSDAIAYFSYRMTLIHIDNEHSQLSSDALSSMVVEYLDPFRKIRESLYAMIDASHLYTAAACRHIQLFSNESRILAIESSALAIALLVPKVIDTMEKDDVNRIVLESIVRECRDISLCIKEMHEINITN